MVTMGVSTAGGAVSASSTAHRWNMTSRSCDGLARRQLEKGTVHTPKGTRERAHSTAVNWETELNTARPRDDPRRQIAERPAAEFGDALPQQLPNVAHVNDLHARAAAYRAHAQRLPLHRPEKMGPIRRTMATMYNNAFILSAPARSRRQSARASKVRTHAASSRARGRECDAMARLRGFVVRVEWDAVLPEKHPRLVLREANQPKGRQNVFAEIRVGGVHLLRPLGVHLQGSAGPLEAARKHPRTRASHKHTRTDTPPPSLSHTYPDTARCAALYTQQRASRQRAPDARAATPL